MSKFNRECPDCGNESGLIKKYEGLMGEKYYACCDICGFETSKVSVKESAIVTWNAMLLEKQKKIDGD